MKISRNVTLWIHFFFDQCLPPLLRDSRWFMWLPFKLLFRDRAEIFFNFKAQAPFLSSAQFRDIYARAAPVFIQRETDLNNACIIEIEKNIVGHTVLDIACGRGFLAKRLAAKYQVTGVDMVLAADLKTVPPNLVFQEGNLEMLPFADRQFDTVVCAHTLEHVQHLEHALSELRRISAQRLIVVLPKQRPYRYTFDLHLHFFPYAHDVLHALGVVTGRQSCEAVGGDWFYMEDRQA